MDAARTILRSGGYHQATTRRIADRAGYDASLIAYYFADKDNLLTRALQPDPDTLKSLESLNALTTRRIGDSRNDSHARDAAPSPAALHLQLLIRTSLTAPPRLPTTVQSQLRHLLTPPSDPTTVSSPAPAPSADLLAYVGALTLALVASAGSATCVA